MATSLDEYLDECMSDSSFAEEWERLSPEYEIIRAVVNARESSGLTQKELAARCGMTQSALSRLETGGSSPTVKTLQQLAKGLGKKLEIRFV
ncbi:helix-turn-helix domain-containing protein [Adlercreutzia sp. ZJ473]|uniref:helix-turn-helix domain-containing protein n=1 Tax=Adlercreutzia sp. ZJ473 TaxID=2722822 RepID=UPI00353036B4